MKLDHSVTVKEIADLIGADFQGNPDQIVKGFNEIHVVDKGDLVFVDHPKYYEKAIQSAASIILINMAVEIPKDKSIIISKDPFKDYNFLTNHFKPFVKSFSDQGEGIKIGANTHIQPNVTIGNNVTIGDNSLIHSGVILYDNISIGNNVIIHANSVIGADAFYFQKRDNGFNKMHTCGSVVIEDNVEIGALTSIDKGVSGITRVGKGTKIDNQVQVGHDTKIGENCLIAAQVGIAGCCNIGNEVTLWGQVGIPSDITIGDKATLLGQSGPASNLEGGKKYFGSPAGEAREEMKRLAFIKKLPELLKK